MRMTTKMMMRRATARRRTHRTIIPSERLSTIVSPCVIPLSPGLTLVYLVLARDPDASPPRSASQRFAFKLSKALRFWQSPEGVFTLRYAIVSLCLWSATCPVLIPHTDTPTDLTLRSCLPVPSVHPATSYLFVCAAIARFASTLTLPGRHLSLAVTQTVLCGRSSWPKRGLVFLLETRYVSRVCRDDPELILL
jgi:hypothetical protein